MTQLIPNGKQQFEDQNGHPLVGGKVYFYSVGTSTPKDTFQDAGETILNTNPVVLNSRGQASIYGTGNYRQVLRDVFGSLIWDQVVVDPANAVSGQLTTFIADLANASDPAKGDALVGVRQPFTGSVPGTQHQKNAERASVKDFGAKGDGVTDDTAAIKLAHLSGKNIYYPSGLYLITDSIPVLKGTIVTGDGGGRYTASDARTSTIRNSTVGGSIFTQIASTTPGQEDGLKTRNIVLQADNPIILNNPAVTISDGGASPPLMRPEVIDCTLLPFTVGTVDGIGISMSKCFELNIRRCDISGFNIDILLQGCDIGEVKQNRLTGFRFRGILELSTSTFGSQTKIHGNDILQGGATSIFIQSTARHARVFDNYLEQASGPCVGFINFSSVNAPQFGLNTPSTTRLSSVVCRYNRIDGHANATGMIYNLEPVGVSASIYDVGTTGTLSALSWLRIEGDELPLFFNVVNACQYDFFGGGQINSKWGGFRNQPLRQENGGVGYAATSLLALNQSQLRANGNDTRVKLTPRGFVLKPTLTTTFNCIFPTVDITATNTWLRNGVTYNVIVVARAKTGTPTLRIARLVNLALQGAVVDTVLNTQDTAIKFTMVGALPTDSVGLGFRPVGGTDDIEISSVDFTPV